MKQEEIIKKLERWEQLLACDGVNSKAMVRNDIQYLLNKLKQEDKVVE